MNNCLLCHSSFRREIDYEKLFLFVKYKERYTCSECLKKFVKKKGKICSGCNKEIDTKGQIGRASCRERVSFAV